MTPEEQNVIDSFEGGEINYENTLAQADYYLYHPAHDMLKIETA